MEKTNKLYGAVRVLRAIELPAAIVLGGMAAFVLGITPWSLVHVLEKLSPFCTACHCPVSTLKPVKSAR